MRNLVRYGRERRGVLIGLLAVGLLAYLPIWTQIIFTNHTLPNSWVNSYPSFKTRYEGRWIADVIVQLTGGAGSQQFQFVAALLVKVANALLLCRLFDLRRSWAVFLASVVLLLHPAFLDYYAFTIDDITFELGDTFAILGVLSLDRARNRLAGVAGAAFFFVLSVASYQPKLALCATLLLLWIATAPRKPGHEETVRSGLEPVVRGGVALIGAVLAYAIVTRVLTTEAGGERQHVNAAGEIVRQAVAAYPEVAWNFTGQVDYLPHALAGLPLLVIGAGLAVMVVRAYRRSALAGTLSLGAVALLPVALRLTYLINDQAWEHQGRILTAHAYLLAVTLIVLLKRRLGRWIGAAAGTILAWSFFIVASQETNAAAMRSVFDENKINRVVARIENVAPDLYSHRRALVVLGELSPNPGQRLKRLPNQLYGSQFATEPFIAYRQAEIVNFYVGRDAVVRPTPAQVAAALRTAAGRRPWPAPESVWIAGETIVVLLKPYAPGVPVTWVEGQAK